MKTFGVEVKSLYRELGGLEKSVLSDPSTPLTALKIAGSRICIASCSEKEEDIIKAQRDLNVAKRIYKLYSQGKIAEPLNLTNNIRIDLHRDYPEHYLSQE